MKYLGKTFKKPVKWNEYKKAAQWCNETQEGKIIEVEDGYKVVPVEETEVSDEQKLFELKSKLAKTDYVVVKIAEGVSSKEDYKDVLAQREQWREDIRELEGKE